ncbi:HAMP domain-containing protein [Sphaerisporangium album]|uniref:histidine kinase n=1 Tax=Sphaerisporangium album TaxID=509200 RepID=A0A367FK80_9ACTN|nr:HAMP domain-containing protein [Sphaerisporangium album]
MPARLTALILVPTVVGVLLATLRVVTSIDSVSAYQRIAAEAQIASHLRDLGMELGLERDTSTWAQVNRQQKAALEEQRRAVDVAITRIRQDLTRIDAAYGVRAVEAARQVGNRLDSLPVLRAGGQPAKFTDVITSILRLHDEISPAAEDVELVGDARGLSALAHAKEEASQQRGTLIGTLLRGGRFTPDTLEDFIAARSRQKSAMNTFNGEAGADNGRYLAQVVRGTQVIRAELTKSWAIALASRNLPIQDGNGRALAVKQWFDDSTKNIELLKQVESRVAESLAARASVLESGERRNAIIAVVLILALVLLVLATTVLIARSLVRPLRRLRSEALEIAGFRLPAVVRRMRESGDAAAAPDVQPILIGTHDEIGEVATAFDEVHRQALRLAAEESQLRGNVNAMFVNLSRRIQTLVERQISLIDGLERGEQDGGRLADLFKLDHLATRMRRNSENLLVLAGHEAARKRSQPAKLVDVVRASLSEVEDYERVNVKVHRSAAVAGHAANDVVHLVAELVENALAFSPGNTRVVVSSSMIEGGGALLAVSDSGIGMTPDEIADTNRRLADPPVVDVSVSRRMGLFVVGRLALRHGIRVQLRRGDSAGLIAMVLFPPQLISVVAGRAPAMPQRDDTQETGPFGGAPGFNDGAAAPAPNGTGSAAVLNGTGSPAAFNGAGAQGAFGPRTGGGPGGRLGPFGEPAPTGPMPARPGPAGPGTAPAGPFGGPMEPPGPGAGTGPVRPRSAFEAPPPAAGPAFGPVGPSTDPSTSALHDLPEPSTGPVRRAPDPSRPAGTFGAPAGPATGPARGGPAPEGFSPWNATARAPVERTPPPVPGDPGAGRWGSTEQGGAGGKAPGVPESPLERGDEYLPIFASVESAWFRRPDTQEIAASRAQESEGPASSPSPRETPADGPRTQEPAPRHAAAGGAWGSEADTGWQAADAVKDPALGGITSAGLPKRKPKANLVPGSVGGTPSQPQAEASSVPRPDVSADVVRARMSRFQQGIQRGRADISQAVPRDHETDRPGADRGRSEEENS